MHTNPRAGLKMVAACLAMISACAWLGGIGVTTGVIWSRGSSINTQMGAD